MKRGSLQHKLELLIFLEKYHNLSRLTQAVNVDYNKIHSYVELFMSKGYVAKKILKGGWKRYYLTRRGRVMATKAKQILHELTSFS